MVLAFDPKSQSADTSNSTDRPKIPEMSTAPGYRPSRPSRHDGAPHDVPAVLLSEVPADPAWTPAGLQPRAVVARRRVVMATLVLATLALLTAGLSVLLAHGGWTVLDGVLLVAFLLSTPWQVIGFWNAVIGFVILHFSRDPMALVAPFLARARPDDPITAKVALALCIRNEDPDAVFARLAVMRRALDATGSGDRFTLFVLSDSSRPEIIAAEEAAMPRLAATARDPATVRYRRRTDNAGFKAGNIREFVDGPGRDFELMITLDADSLMSAEAMLELVRVMQAVPRLGILQSLVVGRPAESGFARLFQFGMRHGMRSYTTGSAWWHADCGPYWGHNAAIRLDAFREHCELPVLPGSPPLGGPVLSHDQIEAAMMRRAGYEVRVLAREGGSFEENPPALPDFLKRDLRWCQGNMQYFKLLDLPGLLPVSRLQVMLAILMYFGAAGWVVFIAASALKVFETPAVIEPFPVAFGVTFFLSILAMSLMPKIAGLLDVAVRRSDRARYGGGARLLAGGLLEFVASTLMAPAVALADAIFMIGLVFGRRVGWDGQKREGYRLTWGQAFRGLWPQVAFGLAIGVLLATTVPAVLPWAAPMLLGLIGAPAFAVFTASPAFGRWLVRHRLCAIPEEFEPDATLLAAEAEERGGREEERLAA
jgi:membrane glycosyltransferase